MIDRALPDAAASLPEACRAGGIRPAAVEGCTGDRTAVRAAVVVRALALIRDAL
jgi:hypothetical protein